MYRVATVDSNKLEHGCRMIYAVPSFLGLGLKHGRVPTSWLQLQSDLFNLIRDEVLFLYWSHVRILQNIPDQMQRPDQGTVD